MVSPFAASAAPAGWMFCDGSSVSRSTYSGLFAAIGTTYGAGNGSTTFNVPDMRGRVPVGRDTGQSEFNVLGETGGATTHTLTVAEMPSHTHTNFGALIARGTGTAFRELTNSGNANSNATSGASGGNQAHNNLQPYRVLNFIIKT
jgi:microcystin-dependent protein